MGEWLSIIRAEPLTYFFKAITVLGNQGFLYFFLPILYWCWKKRAGLFLMILVILACYFNYIIKGLFGWERPPSDLWLINVDGYSFPSTHAVSAVVIWGYLAYEIKRLWFTITAIVLILLIAFSRVYLGVHYPQDVLVGLAVGTFFLHLYRLMIKWFGPRLATVNDLIKSGVVIALSLGMLLIEPNTMIATGAGILAGIYIGFLIEPHVADFDTDGKWYYQILKTVLGLTILLALWQIIDWSFPREASFTYFQFIILGIWIIAGAPWSFIQLRLAKREQ